MSHSWTASPTPVLSHLASCTSISSTLQSVNYLATVCRYTTPVLDIPVPKKSCPFSVTYIVKKKPTNHRPVHMLAFQGDGLLVQLTGESPLVCYPRLSIRYGLSHRSHLKAVFRKPKTQNTLARGRRRT
jgi:hypothetical protein